MNELGIEMFYATFMIEGQPNGDEGEKILNQIISWAGMHSVPNYKTAIWEYPTVLGAGGQGSTIVKPFTMVKPFVEAMFSKPMEESYANIFVPLGMVSADTYIEHNHYFVEIASCKVFSPIDILTKLKESGYRVFGVNCMRTHFGKAKLDFD